MRRTDAPHRGTSAVLSLGVAVVAWHAPTTFLVPLLRWCAEAFALGF